MSAVLSRTEIRQRIDLLEGLHDVMGAMSDVSDVEFEPGESALVDLTISDRGEKKSPIAFAHALPPAVVLEGLRAMQRALEAQLEPLS